MPEAEYDIDVAGTEIEEKTLYEATESYEEFDQWCELLNLFSEVLSEAGRTILPGRTSCCFVDTLQRSLQSDVRKAILLACSERGIATSD